MGIRAPLLTSILLIAIMLAASVYAWPLISDSARVAVHWGVNGLPNGFASKQKALLIGPGMAAVFTLFFAVAPSILPRRANLAKSASAYIAGWVGVVLINTVAHLLVVLNACGVQINARGTATLVSALVLVVIGNFLGKTSPNSIVGVRTPWTRQSAYSWEKSNRAAGRMIVVAGLVALGLLMAADVQLASRALVGGLLVAAVVSTVLSYIYWKRDPDRADAIK